MEPRTQDQLLVKVGGKYKLVSLFQKRMRELIGGLPPLVTGDVSDIWATVTAEVLTDKVALVTGEEAERLRKETPAKDAAEAPALPAAAAAAEAQKAS
jgi:hypothetical protein